jgi:hypothetical protein
MNNGFSKLFNLASEFREEAENIRVEGFHLVPEEKYEDHMLRCKGKAEGYLECGQKLDTVLKSIFIMEEEK